MKHSPWPPSLNSILCRPLSGVDAPAPVQKSLSREKNVFWNPGDNWAFTGLGASLGTLVHTKQKSQMTKWRSNLGDTVSRRPSSIGHWVFQATRCGTPRPRSYYPLGLSPPVQRQRFL